MVKKKQAAAKAKKTTKVDDCVFPQPQVRVTGFAGGTGADRHMLTLSVKIEGAGTMYAAWQAEDGGKVPQELLKDPLTLLGGGL